MEYRTLGQSGLIVSAFGLGTMQFGAGMNMGSLDQQATTDMVKFALDQGINFIDTADVYSRGQSETQLGVALRGLREEVVLASKFRLPMSDTNLNRSGATRVNILRGVESSLKRLQTDYLDLYQVHGWDSHTPLEETLSTLNDLVRQGLVRHIGLSNYLAWQAATALGIQERRGWEPFVTAQLYYSLVGRELEHEWIDLAKYSGLGVLVWSPLAGGYLSAKYDRPEDAPGRHPLRRGRAVCSLRLGQGPPGARGAQASRPAARRDPGPGGAEVDGVAAGHLQRDHRRAQHRAPRREHPVPGHPAHR